MSEQQGYHSRGRGGGRGGGRGSSEHRGGRGGGGGRVGHNTQQQERPKKENILDLSKYMDKRIIVKFNGGREGNRPSLNGSDQVPSSGRMLSGHTSAAENRVTDMRKESKEFC
jgi:hypothetical protein